MESIIGFAKSRSFAYLATHLLLLFSGAYLLTSALDPSRMDADLVVPSLASLNNPTLFYWGQDRLFSLTTFLLLPFHDIGINLYVNTFVQALYFSGLVLFLSNLFASGLYRLCCTFMLSIILILMIIPQPELFTFSKHAQPYAASTLSIFLAYFIILRGKLESSYAIRAALVTGLISIAFLLNPLVLSLAVTLPLSRWILRTDDFKGNLCKQIRLLFLSEWTASLVTGIIILAFAKSFIPCNIT